MAAPVLNAPSMAPTAAPNMGAPSMPSVSMIPAPPTQMQKDESRLNMLKSSGSGVDQILHPVDANGNPTGQPVGFGRKLLGGMARAGDIALSVFGDVSPFGGAIDRELPGTTAHHNHLVAQQQGLIAQDQAQAQSDQQRADNQSLLELHQKEADKYGEQASDMTPFTLTQDQATAINQPTLAGTATTMRDYLKAVASAGNNNTSSSNNANTNSTKQSISDDKNDAAAKAAAAKPMQRDDHYIAVMEKPQDQRTPEDVAFQHAYESLINTKTTQPGIARAAAMGADRAVQIVNPTTGQLNYATAGSAEKSGAASPGSNDYKAEGAALKDFTSGTDAHTLTAFNTAKGHLQQLNVAGDALGNGDVQSLNKLANMYGTATGTSAPVVFQGVKTAVSGEIAKAFTGAGATVDEISEIRQSINDANSPSQLHDVVASYSHLLDTKSGVLRAQFNAARQGQANFSSQPGSGAPAGPKAGDIRPGDGGNYKFNGGDPYDQKNWTKVPK